MKRGRELVETMVSQLCGNIAAGPVATLCGMLATGTITAATLGTAGAALVPLVMLGGVSFLQICRLRRADAKQRRTMQRIQQAVEWLVSEAKERAAAERELVDLAMEQPWLAEAAAKGPEALNAAWQTQVQSLGVELKAIGVNVADVQETLQDLAILEFDSNGRIRGLEEGQKKLLEGQQQIITEQQQQTRAIETLTQQFMGMLREKDAQIGELQDKVMAAIERAVRAEMAKGRPWRKVIEELKTQDPKRLISFLDAELDKDEAEFIEKHRERAAVCFVTGEIDKAAASLGKILALLPHDLDALNRLGHVKQLRGELDEAARLYTRVGEFATDETWRARSLGNLGLIERKRGNLDAAEGFHRNSLAIHEKLGRQEGMAADYGNLGLIEWARGNLDAAEGFHRNSLAIEESLGRLEGMAAEYGNLGLIERARGNLDAAEGHHKTALDINEKLGSLEGMAAGYGNLGLIELTRGNLDAAEGYLKKSLAINEKLGSQEGMAADYGNLGGIELTRGNLDAAEGYHRKSLAIHEKLGRQEGRATNYANLGVIAEQRGDTAEARRLWTLARDMFAKVGMKPQRDTVQGWLDGLGP